MASEKTESPAKTPWIDWRQSGLLSDRYLETMLAEWGSTGLLMLQAPLLAAMVVGVWQNVDRATDSMYFVMTLSCFWIGCMNACREIVKERALFLREKLVNLNVGAYIASKLKILSMLGLVQVAIYTGLIAYFVDVPVGFGWLFIDLFATTLCGTCLGLLLSAWSKRSDVAVGLVPLVILPQILFSEFAISADQFGGWTEVVYTMMPSRWTYESLKLFGEADIDYVDAIIHIFPPLIFAGVFLVLAWPRLRWARY